MYLAYTSYTCPSDCSDCTECGQLQWDSTAELPQRIGKESSGHCQRYSTTQCTSVFQHYSPDDPLFEQEMA